MYSMVGAISTEPVWCSCRLEPGSAMKSGSSARARLIFTTPLRVFQCSMSPGEVRRQVLPADLVQERGPRVQGGHDHPGPQLVAVVQHHPAGPAVLRR